MTILIYLHIQPIVVAVYLCYLVNPSLISNSEASLSTTRDIESVAWGSLALSDAEPCFSTSLHFLLLLQVPRLHDAVLASALLANRKL